MAHESAHQGKQVSLSSSGFCYQDFSNNNPMQSFEPTPAELFNLQNGMEILAVASKNTNNNDLEPSDHCSHTTLWRGFQAIKPGYHGSSSSKALATDASDDFYQPSEFHKPDFSSGDFSETMTENFIGTPETMPWQTNRLLVDDSSLRCLFPGVRNDQRTQGLSLSLCNVQQSDAVSLCNVQQSDAVLQHQLPFEYRELMSNHHQLDMRHLSANLRDGLLSKSTNNLQQQQQVLLQDGRFYSSLSSSSSPGLCQQSHSLRTSKYLAPAQEVLTEFCKLGASGSKGGGTKKNFSRSNQWDEGGSSSSSSTWNQSLFSLDILELQKRKAKLLSILEEVDRRYRIYCDQMRTVVSSFDAVAGEGAAKVYSTLASKAMSRHFRCLRDGVVWQIRAVKKAMGEKDPIAPGSTKGETPRLKLVDQCLRQQKAFQQAGLMETHPWRPQRGLPERSVSFLRAWLFEHFLHPYPSDVDKHILARQTGLSRSQVSNWFINARVRLWKPMVEEMYLEETKDMENQSSHGAPVHEDSSSRLPQNPNPNPNSYNLSPCLEDQKPLPGQLINDSESLSSIINNHHSRERRNLMSSRNPHQTFSMGSGVMDIDFASYNDCGHEKRFGNSVSLTLGLQQHNGGGMSLSSPASRNSLFFPRETMDNCQPLQFSILDGDGQNIPYRNLMGTQLLHDLPG